LLKEKDEQEVKKTLEDSRPPKFRYGETVEGTASRGGFESGVEIAKVVGHVRGRRYIVGSRSRPHLRPSHWLYHIDVGGVMWYAKEDDLRRHVPKSAGWEPKESR
jgi:hypothetical protein